MALPLMPKATAVWLVENTKLTFEQIAAFCGMHPLEVHAIADGEAAIGMVGLDPISSGQLTQAEIERCENDPHTHLALTPPVDVSTLLSKKKGKYTPVAKRQDRPDAIAWVLKNHPEITDARICKLLGTTKQMVHSVRSRSHWNTSNIKPKNPVTLGFCTQQELDAAIALSPKKD